MPEIAVSVIVLTHNPQPALLLRTLDSIAKQSVAPEDFEVLIVDNASAPPIDADVLSTGRPFRLRVVREARLGIMHARLAGLSATTAPLIVFVDDDNFVANDYLEMAIRIARENPGLGAFGGISAAVFQQQPAEWKHKFLPYLGVRDYGPEPITSDSGEWGKWEPIGAGMVIRGDVGTRFAEFVAANPPAMRLGRSGKQMMSGEDSLLARAACMLGYSCSYQPSLRLEHYMK